MPSYPNPVYPNWGESLGGGLNSGFDSIMQGIATRRQNQMAGLEFQTKTGFDPQRLMQGQQLQQEFAGTPNFSPANAGNVLSPQEQGLWGEYQSFQKSMRDRFSANTQDTQAQANERQTKSDLLKKASGMNGPDGGPTIHTDPASGRQYYFSLGMGGLPEWKPVTGGSASGGLTPVQQSALQFGIEKGYTTPEQIKTRGAQAAVMADGLSGRSNFKQWYSDKQAGNTPTADNFNPAASAINFAGNKANVTAREKIKGGAGHVVGSMAGTLDDMLGQMRPLVAQLSPTQFQVLNDAWAKGLKQTNDPVVNQLLPLRQGAVGAYASVIKGGQASPTDKEFVMADGAIGRGMNIDAFDAMARGVTAESKSRTTRLQGRGFQEPNPLARNAPAAGGERQVELPRADGSGTRAAIYNGKKFMRWADGKQ